MRIAINGRSCLNKNPTGIGRYTYHLIKSLLEVDRDNVYTLYYQKGLFDFRKQPPQIEVKNLSYQADYFNAGSQKLLQRYNVYHVPSPDVLKAPEPPTVVTVHDVIFKTYAKGHTQETVEATHKQFESIIKYAAHIICCSQNTWNDLKKYFPRAAQKASVIHEAVDRTIFYPLKPDEESQAKQLVQEKGLKDPFILFVGTIEPRKNLANLLRAFFFLKEQKKFSGKLAVIGMKGWLSDWVSMLIEQLKLKDDVIFLGYLSNAELRAFYNQAKMLVFPSFYEGFGFPILEAFSCGTPVVTSNVSSCPEIAGEAALTVDPNSIEDLTQGMAKVLENPQLQEEMREKGFQRVKDFSFHKMARETLEVYKSLSFKR